MIGNMWAIPENAMRPTDARKKNPAIISSQIEESNVRRELKKLLKVLFKITEELEIAEKEKNIVLFEIACGLCAFYLKEKTISHDIKKNIYRDISGKEFTSIHDGEMVREIFNFIEKYMINYLIHNISDLQNADKIVDPCAGGGNFLVECLKFICAQIKETEHDFIQRVILNVTKLYGYDIDHNITRIALVNIRLRVLAILNHRNEEATIKGMSSEQKDFLKKNYPNAKRG